MCPPLQSTSFLRLLFLLLRFLLQAPGTAIAQNCYYPNGDTSSTDASCGGGSGMCCPLQWQCLSNGLCSLPGQALLGRYTCTDRSWSPRNCRQFCTHKGSASGNEDIQLCSDGSYCCNGDGSLDCCSALDTDFLDLGSARAVATITALSPATSVVLTSSAPGSSLLSSSSAGSATSQVVASPSSASSAETPARAATGDSTSSAQLTEVTASFAAPSDFNSPEPAERNLGLILGLAIGVPAGVLALATALVLAHRCHRKLPSTPPSSDMTKNSAILHGHDPFSPGGRSPELDGYPVAHAQPGSDIRRSELPYSPAVSSLRDSYASPPRYSTAVSPELLSVNEASPAELWAGYVPYRPPRTSAQELAVASDGAPMSISQRESEAATAP